MLVGIEVRAFGLDGVYVLFVKEGDELLLNETNTFAYGLDVIGLGHSLGSPFKIIHQRQHLFEDTLAGCGHELDLLLVGTATVVIELRHHTQVLILQFRDTCLQFLHTRCRFFLHLFLNRLLNRLFYLLFHLFFYFLFLTHNCIVLHFGIVK